MKNIQSLKPAVTTHPGEVLADELQARGISQKKFAELIGMQPSQLNEIIKGKRNITAQTALIFETHLQINAQVWLNLQSNYELDLLRTRSKHSITKTDLLPLHNIQRTATSAAASSN